MLSITPSPRTRGLLSVHIHGSQASFFTLPISDGRGRRGWGGVGGWGSRHNTVTICGGSPATAVWCYRKMQRLDPEAFSMWAILRPVFRLFRDWTLHLSGLWPASIYTPFLPAKSTNGVLLFPSLSSSSVTHDHFKGKMPQLDSCGLYSFDIYRKISNHLSKLYLTKNFKDI